MRALIIGKGGREHAFAKAFLKNSTIDKLYIAPGNAGMREERIILHEDDSLESLLSLCVDNDVKYILIGSETYLEQGYADAFRKIGLSVVGPNQNAAQLETSKDFCKQYLHAADIPTADSDTFTDLETLKFNCEALIRDRPVVLKWDHLAAGKGVFICHDKEDLDKAYKEIKKLKGKFSCLVEDYLEGKEVSSFVYVDNGAAYYMGSACDYKRRSSDTNSPNTGGMGAFSPNNKIAEGNLKNISEDYTKRLLKALEKDGIDFNGFIFWGFMLLGSIPYVLEINTRFGDPEAQAVLPRIQTDLFSFLFAADKPKLEFVDKTCIHLVKVDPDYPYTSNLRAEVDLKPGPLEVYFSAVKVKADKLYTCGGRILGLSAMAENLDLARELLYSEHQQASFAEEDFRRDIGC